MYKYLLFDLDNTLLDFSKAEARSLKDTFKHFGKTINDNDLENFRVINLKYWKMFELGKISKEQLLVSRFNEFFSKISINTINPSDFNSYYLNALTNSAEEINGSYELIKKLNGFDLSIITNGVTHTQKTRIDKSRIGKYFNHIYISDEIGYQKPKKEFFDYVFKDLNITNKKEVLLIGDSLTSDIIGGINYGIDTVWFNPNNLESDIKPIYIIKKLDEIENVLGLGE